MKGEVDVKRKEVNKYKALNKKMERDLNKNEKCVEKINSLEDFSNNQREAAGMELKNLFVEAEIDKNQTKGKI